jgi:hypothetical protein
MVGSKALYFSVVLATSAVAVDIDHRLEQTVFQKSSSGYSFQTIRCLLLGRHVSCQRNHCLHSQSMLVATLVGTGGLRRICASTGTHIAG